MTVASRKARQKIERRRLRRFPFTPFATNAARYGALGVLTAKVEVSWNIYPADSQLTISWKESGGPQVIPSTRKGFGTRLIHALSAGQLGGQVQLTYKVSGVHCIMIAPLDSGWSDHDHL